MILLIGAMVILGGMTLLNSSIASETRSQGLREVGQILSVNDIRSFSNKRDQYWANAIELVSFKPLLGWGWVNAPLDTKLSDHQKEQLSGLASRPQVAEPGHAHNMYLNIAVYGGIPTLFAVILIHFLSISRAFQLIKTIPSMKIVYGTVFITVLSQILYNFAGDIFNFRYKAALIFWTLMGLTLRKISRSSSDSV